MGISVESRIHRTLAYLEAFAVGSACQWSNNIHFPFAKNERLLGCYENVKGSYEDVIFVTNFGLYFCEGGTWKSILYRELVKTSTPDEKTIATRLTLHLKSGTSQTIPILGGKGRLRDLFEVMRFLDRVISDL